MNCERAEEHLSAFLDHALDSQSHSDVQAHLAQCSRCQAILDEYRANDQLLVTLPRVAPPAALRARLFRSPEYQAILADLDARDASQRDASGAPPLLFPTPQPAHDTPSPLSAGAAQGATVGAEAMPRRGSLPPWARVALPAAAAVALALGGGYAALHRAPSSRTTTGHGISTFGDPGQNGIPLAAGPRVVYERSGTLWSAQERGGSLAQALTPQGTRVAGWAVSPLVSASNARLVVYVDARTGAIHLIRSDGQGDRVIGSVSGGITLDASFWASARGQAINAGLSWSPDAARIAYLATDATGNMRLHVMNADGSNDQAITAGAPALPSAATWSGDSLWLAFTQTSQVGQTLWALDVNRQRSYQIAAQADPTDTRAAVTRITWLATPGNPALTWAARDGESITGIFAAHVLSGTSAQRLTPDATSLTAADFSATNGGGTWLAANGSAIFTVAPFGAGWAPAGTAPAAISHIAWAPTGAYAALAGGGQVALWSASQGMLPVSHPISGAVAPVWSSDGLRLAYTTGDGVTLLRLYNGGLAATVAQVRAPGATAVRWAPDSQSFAVAMPSGVLVVASNGTAPRLVDTSPADGGALAWSNAR
ncbi:MAG: zf-HC2 domain-containing protein [Ktedonobacterales bacterium]|nr:zf-HC2 domain-containing protein [Ktedonobacterales bacterium]